MKVLLINGSPNARGCTYTALSEAAASLQKEGVETEILHVGHRDLRGCIDKTMKVGAAVVSCRRGGASATFDEINKFFTISGMPVASSQYWNSVHGNTPEEVGQDLEGLQIMRTLGRNMAFLVKSIALGREKLGLPEKEPRVSTNFIR